MFFCDPPGDTSPEALLNFGAYPAKLNYIWFYDQEPIYLDTPKNLFDDVIRRNLDLNHGNGAKHAVIVTSEHIRNYVRGN